MSFLKEKLPALRPSEKYIGIAYLVFQFALLPLLLQMAATALSWEVDGTAINALYFSINFLATLVIFRQLLKRSVLQMVHDPEALLFASAVGFGVYRVSSIVIGLLITLLFPDFANLNDGAVIDILGQYPLLMFVCTVVLAPVAEELLFRGLIFGWLQEKNVLLGYILSTLLFAAIHVVQYIGLYSVEHIFVALVMYLPAGLCFAWAYQRSGSIISPILIHAINNFLAFLILR